MANNTRYLQYARLPSKLGKTIDECWLLASSLKGVTSGGGGLDPLVPSPAGTYTYAAITVDVYGRVTAAASGVEDQTLLECYQAGSAGPQYLNLDSTRLGVVVRDAATPIGALLWSVQKNDGSEFFGVYADKVVTGQPLRLSGSTSGYVGLQGAAAAGSTTYTLPAADGAAGEQLTTNGAGTLSWASGGVSDHNSMTGLDGGQTVGTFTEYYHLTSAEYTTLQAGSYDHGALTGLTDDDHVDYVRKSTGRAGGTVIIGGTGTTDDLTLRATAGVGASGSDIIFQVGNNGATEAGRILYDGKWGFGTNAPGSEVDIKGTLRLSGATSGYVGFAPAAAAGSTTYVLPAADGAASTSLFTDGAGNLSWQAPGSAVDRLTLTSYACPTACTATLNVTAGNVTGKKRYYITFVGGYGETEVGAASAAMADTPTNQQIDLTNIPLGPSGTTARRIYRVPTYTLDATPGGEARLVYEIPDNATTIYTDNIADGSLGAYLTQLNTTGGEIYSGANRLFSFSSVGTAIGIGAIATNTGWRCLAIGASALAANTYGAFCVAIGDGVLAKNTSGLANIGIGGSTTLGNCTTGTSNIAIGGGALNSVVSYGNNVAVGPNAGLSSIYGDNVFIGSAACAYGYGSRSIHIGRTAGENVKGGESIYIGYMAGRGAGAMTSGVDYNVVIGSAAGYSMINAQHNCVFLGYKAGYYEQTSHRLYVADSDTANPLIYGKFDTGQLTFNSIGGATADTDVLALTNLSNAAAMTDTRTSLLFNQWYYDAATPAIADAGKITVGTEGNWTSTASTQDSYMAFSTCLDGTVAEKVWITSAGYVGVGTAAPLGKLEVSGVGLGLRLFSNYASELESTTTLNSILFSKHLVAAPTDTWKIYNVATFATHGYDGSDLRFASSYLSSGLVDRITFTQAGLVGIGTTAPDCLLTLNAGTSPTVAAHLDIAALGAEGTRDSHALQWTGRASTIVGTFGADFTADWKQYVDVTSTSGASAMTWQSRIDAASYATRMTLDNDGLLTLNPGTTPAAALFLDIAAPVVGDSGQESHSIQWQASFLDGYLVTTAWDFRALTEASGSATYLAVWKLAARKNSDAFADVFSVNGIGGIGAFGCTPPATQPALPAGTDSQKIADIIAVLVGCGLCAPS
jgi:hypothetical protein